MKSRRFEVPFIGEMSTNHNSVRIQTGESSKGRVSIQWTKLHSFANGVFMLGVNLVNQKRFAPRGSNDGILMDVHLGRKGTEFAVVYDPDYYL